MLKHIARVVRGAAWLIALTCAERDASAQSCATSTYIKSTYFQLDNAYHPSGVNCSGQGWCGINPPCPTPQAPLSPLPPNWCPKLLRIELDSYNCSTDAFVQGVSNLRGTGPWGSTLCPCDPGDQAIIAAHPDGGYGDYHCGEQGCTCTQNDPDPGYCDGRPCQAPELVDSGCGDDEHGCTSAHGTDPFPVNLASGRVESSPITLFSLPTPEGIEFGLTIKYDSHLRSAIAVPRSGDANPTIHQADELTHIIGRNWTDNFSDRLRISVFGLDSSGGVDTWERINGIVTFRNGKSTSGKYELLEYPASYTIRSTDTSAPRSIWEFEKIVYTSLSGQQETIARLTRHAIAGTGSDTGFYGYSLAWATDGTITSITDTLGRQLLFTYAAYPSGCTSTCKYRVVSGLRYKPKSSEQAVFDVATLIPTTISGGQLLDRVQQFGVGSYKRFLYLVPPTSCKNCNVALTDVIVPAAGAGSTLPPQAPVAPGEVVLEHHAFLTPSDYQRPRVIESSGPGRHYGYSWNEGTHSGIQYDLNQPTGACAGTPPTNCATGSACYSGMCYLAEQLQWDAALRLPVQHFPFGGTSVGSGDPNAVNIAFLSTTGEPKRTTDNANTRTTNGYDSKGRLRCIVRNDNDDEAFATPSQPDTSACAGPANAQIVRVDYTASTITKTTPGLIGASVVEVQNLDQPSASCSAAAGGTLLPCSTTTTGTTHDIGGTPVVISKTTSTTYDAFGRVTEENGPLDDATALDKTTISYYATYDASWPNDLGRVQSVTRYVGTTASNTPLTTAYAEYDVFGVPHKVTGPNGDYVVYADSNSRLTWTITHKSASGVVIGVSSATLNGDGSVHSMQDADGVCLTYEYTDSSGAYVGAPTRIRRSNTACGAAIDVNSGEVEIRTYLSNEPDRLNSIERRSNGVTEFTYSGFSYDRDRRLISATTLDSGTPFTFGFTDVLPSSTVAPGAPADGSWRTDTSADEFGRPTSLLRFITSTDTQTYTYSYATAFTPRPTQLARGYNGSSTSITTFVYDDFGRLVETTVPEAGAPGSPAPTRYEYDIASRMIKKRIGTGTAGVRTDVYAYDSLSRITFVDHDTEHPVNCSTAPDGTPIQDEEYRYDNCTGELTCSNALGRLTSSRAVLQCSSGQVIKRGRWYDYDSAGRLATLTWATVTGSTIGPGAVSNYSYTAAGRLVSWTNPVVSVYGTKYILDAASGRPTEIRDSQISTPYVFATGLTYRAFGPLTGLDTTISQPAGTGDTRKLTLRNTYRSDDSLSVLNWSLVPATGTPSTIMIVKDTMSYGPAGLLSHREDSADILSSRYYGYDALLRMTCEARGSGTTEPSSSDCVTSSTRLAGLYTYGDGQSATQPPDVRLTAFINGAGTTGASYTSPSTESYTYLGGSGQTQQITRAGSDIVLGYDTLGRRTFDYDSADSQGSRRDYTYLPNGQLGTVSGFDQNGQAYSIAVRYDPEGRPLTIANNTDTYELYWDDADRLIGVQINPGNPTTGIGWSYHYLGSQLVAATRVSYVDGAIKRFWAATDERALIYRLLDEQGATYWQAQWDATGWRQLVGTPQPDMWAPFAMRGQIPLERTEAFTSGSSTAVRPGITLNQWRAYDPLLGQFLHFDGNDQSGRRDPEGYSYGRSNPVLYMDIDGLSASVDLIGLAATLVRTLSFDDSCDSSERLALTLATASAILQVDRCAWGECDTSGAKRGDFVQRQWIYSLMNERFSCPKKGRHGNLFIIDSEGPYKGMLFVIFGGNIASSIGLGYHRNGLGYPNMTLPPAAFDPSWSLATQPLADAESGVCLTKTVAHEALHHANQMITPSAVFQNGNNDPLWGGLPYQHLRTYAEFLDSIPEGLLGGEHTAIHGTISDCIGC